MQTMSIQFPVPDDDPDLAARVLRAVADALGTADQDQAIDLPATASAPFVGIDGLPSLQRLLAKITPKARWLLRQIASDNIAEGESRGRTIRQRAGNVNEGTLGGWVWSISSATSKMKLPKPYDTDYEERADGWQVIYRMDREVAQTIVSLIDEEGSLLG